MDTLIKVRTDLRYLPWRSYAASLRILFISICIAAATAPILIHFHTSTPAQTVLSKSYEPSQATHQQIADRYRDPALTYFFGE